MVKFFDIFRNRKEKEAKSLKIFGCEVIFSSNFYQICAKNREKADSINNYLKTEGFLDEIFSF